MTRTFQDKKTNVSAQVTQADFKKISRYCKQNNLKLSQLVRRALMREIQSQPEFEIMSEVEKLVDSKIEEKMKIVDISAKKIN
jgi:hypothetical protein